MTTELIVVMAAAGIIWFAILFLRIPAFAALFSLLIGQMLSSQAGEDAYQFASGLTGIAQYQYVQIALLLLPFILTAYFLKGRTSKSKLAYEAMPALFTSLTLLLLLYPLLPILTTVMDIATNDTLEQYKVLVFIAASVLGLISVWTSVPKAHADKHEK